MKKVFNKKILFSGIVLFGAYFLLAVDDIIDDVHDNVPAIHIAANLAFLSAAIFALIFYIRISYKEIKAEIDRRGRITDRAIQDSEELTTQVATLKSGVTKTINSHFIIWLFSEAERDIAFLLLKGFSFKEIGNIRSTSEKTVRDQATRIYKKSGTKNRAEFVAFFLEDLLG